MPRRPAERRRTRHGGGAGGVDRDGLRVVAGIDEAVHHVAHAADAHHAVAGVLDDHVARQRPQRACDALAVARRRGRVDAAAQQEHRHRARPQRVEAGRHRATRPVGAEPLVEGGELGPELGAGLVGGRAEPRRILGTDHRQVHAGGERVGLRETKVEARPTRPASSPRDASSSARGRAEASGGE
jgi:hypothetical protein